MKIEIEFVSPPLWARWLIFRRSLRPSVLWKQRVRVDFGRRHDELVLFLFQEKTRLSNATEAINNATEQFSVAAGSTRKLRNSIEDLCRATPRWARLGAFFKRLFAVPLVGCDGFAPFSLRHAVRKTMSRFIKCSCQNCNETIEFDAEQMGGAQTINVECPHCQKQTTLFDNGDRRYRATKASKMMFKNPANGYTEEVARDAWAYVLLFGCLYFAVKGVWTHAVAGFVLAFLTCGMSWLVYPFFANKIMKNHYLRKGWIQVN
jgi:ribosomal protein S27E